MAKKKTKNEATWDEVEKEVVLMKTLINRLPDEMKECAGLRMCFEAALWAGGSFAGMLGILEASKVAIIEADKDMEEAEADEE